VTRLGPRLGLALGAALAAFAVWLVFVDRSPKVVKAELQPWNLYHYAVGAGFFAEVGYWDLYPLTLDVDRAGDNSLRSILVVRDLRTGEKVPRGTLQVPSVPAHRRRELGAWVDALEPLEPLGTWRQMFTDRGYNASPAFTAVAGPLARAFPPTAPANRTLLALLDPVLLTVAIAALASKSARGAAGWALLFVAFPGVWHRQVGGFLEYDWLAALLVGAVATSAGSPRTAAVALAWATTTRVFPGMLVATMLVPGAWRAWRTGHLARFERTFLPTFALAGLAFVALGCTAGHGLASWAEFAVRIQEHASRHAGGEQRVGLGHLWTLGGAPSADEPVMAALLAERAPLRWASAALLLLASWLASLRRTRAEALFLGMVAVFALTVTSRYYAAAFLAWPVFAIRGSWLWLAWLALPLAGWLTWQAGLGPRATWWVLEGMVLAACSARLLQLLARDFAVVRRSRLRGRPG
jgi:hypothetical protein